MARIDLRADVTPLTEHDHRLDHAVHQALLGRLDGMDARATAAFVYGWASALELARRTDLTMSAQPPDIRDAVAQAIEASIEAIEASRRRVLSDD